MNITISEDISLRPVILGTIFSHWQRGNIFQMLIFFVDRDGLSGFRNEFKCKLIANGWYYLFDGCHQWSDCLEPLLTSVHINNTDNANEFHNVLDKLKAASQKSYRMQGLCDTKIFTIKWYCMFLFFMFNNNSAKKRLF